MSVVNSDIIFAHCNAERIAVTLERDTLRAELEAARAELAEYRTLRPAKCRPACWSNGWEAAREAAAHAKTDQNTDTVLGWDAMTPVEKRMWRHGYVCGTQDMSDSIRALVPPADCGGACNPLEPDARLSAIEVRDHLRAMTSDEDRYNFLQCLDVCLLCGQIGTPCYCAPRYDE